MMQNDSIIALSRPSPMLPNDGIILEERILFVNAQDVNWVSCSACTTPPGVGARFLIAISRALTTRWGLPLLWLTR